MNRGSRQDQNANSSFWTFKIFIGGVPIKTTEDQLMSHFKNYGEILDLVIIKEKSNGKPRGFGFVTFKEEEAYLSALEDQHIMNGKRLDLKAANPRESNPAPTQLREKKTQENKKIFIGGLPKDLTMNEFRSYFEQYGEIVDIAIITDKKTREPRGFGFVSYKNVQSARDVIRDYSLHKFRDRWVECKMSYPKEMGNEMGFEDQSPNSVSPGHSRSKGNFHGGYSHPSNGHGSNHNSSPVGSYPDVGEPPRKYGANPNFNYQSSYGSYHQPYGSYSSGQNMEKSYDRVHHQDYNYGVPTQGYHYNSVPIHEHAGYNNYPNQGYYQESAYYYNEYEENRTHEPPKSPKKTADSRQQELAEDSRQQMQQQGSPEGLGGAGSNNSGLANKGQNYNNRILHSASMSPQHDIGPQQHFNLMYASVGASPNLHGTRAIGQGMLTSYSGPLGATNGVYQTGQVSSNEENAAIFQKGGPNSASAGIGGGQEGANALITPKKSIHHENELRKMYASQRAYSGVDYERQQGPQEIIPRKPILSRVLTEDLREYGSKEEGGQGFQGLGVGSLKQNPQFRSGFPIMKSHSLHPDEVSMYEPKGGNPSQMFKLFNAENYQAKHGSMEIAAMDPSTQGQPRKAELRKAGSQSSVNQQGSGGFGEANPQSLGNLAVSAYNSSALPHSNFTIHRSNSGVYGGSSGPQTGASAPSPLGSVPPGLGPVSNT